MSVISLLVSTKLRIVKTALLSADTNIRMRSASIAIFLFALMYLAYLFFHDLLFAYVVRLEDIGFLLIERLVSTGFLAFFFMLMISSFVTALALMFKSQETEYLFSTPVTSLDIFTVKFIDVVVYSSWAILLMAVPILYSYARVREFSTLEYAVTGLFVLIPFIVTATALGTLLALFAVHFSRRISVRRFILLGLLVFISLIYLVIRFSKPNEMVIPFTEDFRALNIFINNFRLNSHPLTPNFWFIQSLRSLVLHNYREFAIHAAALLTSAFFAVMLLFTVGERIYYATWLISNEQRQQERASRLSGRKARLSLLGTPPESPFAALTAKDILMFVRNPGQWSQTLLITALVAVYFVNLNFIPDNIELLQWRTIISIINFAFAGLVIATLAVRFVYPSISLEGDAAWVLGSSPLPVTTLFREKLATAFITFLFIGEIIALVSGLMLPIEPLYRWLTMGGIFLMSIALSCLAVGFGAAYPDFTETNPSKIASSTGGIITVACSLIYIALMLVFLAIPSYRYTEYLINGGDFPEAVIAFSIAGAILLNAVTIVIPVKHGMKILSTWEY